MAAFNGSRWIDEQIQSILDQSDVDVTLIISDDGSSDDTRKKIQHYQKSDPRVTCIWPEKTTGSAAQNFLWLIRKMPLQHHSFVSLADQDDVWDRNKLSRGALAIASGCDAGYSCAVTAFWEDGQSLKLGQQDRQTGADFLFEGAGQGCTFLLAADFYCRVREFMLNHATETAAVHYHDWLIYALSRSWGLSWVFDKHPMLRYRQHASNDTGARYSVSGVHRRIGLLRDGWYAKQLQLIAKICRSAAPENLTILEWFNLVLRPPSLSRRLRIARFCMQNGRRRSSDRAILVGAALAGWL
jgi:rhamnosyltransferase